MRTLGIQLLALLSILASTCGSQGQTGQPAAGQSLTGGLPSLPNFGPSNQSISGRFGSTSMGLSMLPGGKNPIGQPSPNVFVRPGAGPSLNLNLPVSVRSISEPDVSGWITSGWFGNRASSGTPLFQNADVRRALDLTDDQVKRLSEAQTQSQVWYESQFGKLSPGDYANRAIAMQLLRKNQQDEFS